MKKIENWLLLPILILFCWSLAAAPHTLDIHLHDTYFVLDSAFTFRFLGGALLLLFGLYKTIRNRHQTINQVFAAPHLLITILLTGLLLIPFATEVRFIDYNNWSNWTSYQSNLLRPSIVVNAYVLTQFIFLIYFITQMVKRPISSQS